jgi:hypothetical protein
MNGHHHPHHGHHTCGCCCSSRAYCTACADETAWALGELVVAPLVALATVVAWLARRPVALVIVLGAAVVALAVVQAVMGP